MVLHTETGKLGEEIAKEYLEKHGYTIIEQNYRTRYSELDLIAYKDKWLVFVEVRTKIGEQFGSPEETINRKKIATLQRASAAYAAINRHKGQYRIDAVCIVLQPNQQVERINHYTNI